ncbi:MAG: hypothetical protein HND51_14595 [Chloroflexi bacterium]|nr:hypothetical protein [Chloroflexota bacterium]
MANLTHRNNLYQGNVERYRQEQRDMAQAWTLTVFSALIALFVAAAFFTSLML